MGKQREAQLIIAVTGNREAQPMVKKLQMLLYEPTGEKVRVFSLLYLEEFLQEVRHVEFLAVQMVRLLTDSGSSGAAAVMLTGMAAGAFMLGNRYPWTGEAQEIQKISETLGKRNLLMILQSLRRQSESL